MEDKDLPQFIKGYEQGYWLQRGNRQELNDIITRAQTRPTYQYGLKSGAKEAEREKVREQFKNNKEQSTNPEKGMDMD